MNDLNFAIKSNDCRHPPKINELHFQDIHTISSGTRTILHQNWKEKYPFYIQGCPISMSNSKKYFEHLGKGQLFENLCLRSDLKVCNFS